MKLGSESEGSAGERGRLQPESDGSGPLLERDYWAVLEGEDLTPQSLAAMLATQFSDFAPPELVRFHRKHGSGELQVGDELEVDIRMAGDFDVRVIHRDENSLTIGTLEGHPEAGRITFGAYPNDRGDIVFHIRSRARAGSRKKFFGFLFAGDPMQTNTWSDFINRVAATAGAAIVGAVHAEKRKVEVEPGDRRMDRPTFIAEGN